MTVTPNYARAQSGGSRVWVVDDTTAQALATCKRSDGACPTGSIRAFHIRSISLSDAQAQHRPYLQLATPSTADIHRFIHQAFPAPQPNAALIAGTANKISPMACPSTSDDYWDFNIPSDGAEIKAHQSIQRNCDGTVQALVDQELYVSGHGTWRSDSANVSTNVYEDSDNGSSCDGLDNRTYTFGGHPFTDSGPNSNGPYTEVYYFAGSACQSWDNGDTIDYYWYGY